MVKVINVKFTKTDIKIYSLDMSISVPSIKEIDSKAAEHTLMLN